MNKQYARVDSEKPRCGIIGANSELLNTDYLYDLIDINNMIDLSYESSIKELTDEQIEELMDCFESGPNYLIGSWVKVDGKYQVDYNGEFSGTYNSDSNTVCIEYSKTTRETHHTSPCYIMADGSGQCGDLETSGDSVISYDLPKEYYNSGVR